MRPSYIVILFCVFVIFTSIVFFRSPILIGKEEMCLSADNDINWKYMKTLEAMEVCFSDFGKKFSTIEKLQSWLRDQGFTAIEIYSRSASRMASFGEKDAGFLLSATWQKEAHPFPFLLFPFRPSQSLGASSFVVSLVFSQSNNLLETKVSFTRL